ncbi:MAG: ferredoxin [bacterium]
MRAKIDEGLCTGCGVCSEGCPEVFELGDDSIAKVIVDTVPADSEDRVKDCASSCPVTCIEVTE